MFDPNPIQVNVSPELAILPGGLVTPVWTDDDLRVMNIINTHWNRTGREVTRELKVFLRDAKKHLNVKPGRPKKGAKTWSGFIADLAALNDGDFPCRKQVDIWISELNDEDLLYPLDVSEYPDTPEEDEDDQDDEYDEPEPDIKPARPKSSRKSSSDTKLKTKKLKVEDISAADARFYGFQVSQDLEDGTYVIKFHDSQTGNVYEQTVTCDRPLEPVPEHLIAANLDRILPANPTVAVFFGGMGMVGLAAQWAGYVTRFYSEWIPDEEGGNGGTLKVKSVPVKNTRLKYNDPNLTSSNIMRLSIILPEALKQLSAEEVAAYEEKKALYDQEWARLEEEESKIYLSELPEGTTTELPAGRDDESIAHVPTSTRPQEEWRNIIGDLSDEQLDEILKLSGLSLGQYAWMVQYQNAFATLVANNPQEYARGCLLNKDITKITKADLRKAGLTPGSVDLIQFSPPCQAFSDMNHLAGREWDPRANLGFYALRICAYLLPKVILLENVPGLVHKHCVGKHREMFNVAEKNYYVTHDVLNASAWGSSQERKRLWWIGYRRDLGIIPTFPAPTVAKENFTTLAQVCPDVLGFKREGTMVVRKDGKVVFDALGNKMRQEYPYQDSNRPVGAILKKGGKLFDYVGEGLQVPKVSSLRAVFGVPEDYLLVGTDTQKSERLGNAVIPAMAEVLLTHILKEVRTHQSKLEGTIDGQNFDSSAA